MSKLVKLDKAIIEKHLLKILRHAKDDELISPKEDTTLNSFEFEELEDLEFVLCICEVFSLSYRNTNWVAFSSYGEVIDEIYAQCNSSDWQGDESTILRLEKTQNLPFVAPPRGKERKYLYARFVLTWILSIGAICLTFYLLRPN